MVVDLEKVIGVKCEVLEEVLRKGMFSHEKIVRVSDTNSADTDFAVPNNLVKPFGNKKDEFYVGVTRVLSEEGGKYHVEIFLEGNAYIHIDVHEGQLVLSS